MGHPPKGQYNEIIEIGISTVDYVTKEVIDKDTIIVKPKYSEISGFCTKLTTITQSLIDEEGVSFEEACEMLETKFKSRGRVWMSFGEYDKNQIERDCELKNVRNPFGRTHFNIKELFSLAYGLSKDLGVQSALDYLGLKFEGTPHRGGDDAFNTAKLVKPIFSAFQK